MTKRNLKRYKYPYKMIYVKWDDAATNPGWFTTEKAKIWMETGISQCIAEEMGFLIGEDDLAIFLASRCIPKTDYSDEQLGSLHRIPRNWILKKRLVVK